MSGESRKGVQSSCAEVTPVKRRTDKTYRFRFVGRFHGSSVESRVAPAFLPYSRDFIPCSAQQHFGRTYNIKMDTWFIQRVQTSIFFSKPELVFFQECVQVFTRIRHFTSDHNDDCQAGQIGF